MKTLKMRVREYLLLLLVIMMMIILEPDKYRVSANSWNDTVQLNITTTYNADAELSMDPHLSSMLIISKRGFTLFALNIGRVLPSCPDQQRYTDCLGPRKFTKGNRRCSVFTRDCQ
ncbi:hypothetical protein L6164_006692 [Bauhinia variegata]|uniref:Uncharacterized protein n=1 Tax=Bauhinia variegata TaxID=167791 RepID=A0ACB9PXA9_BAUVA|nr:hypothetical protein L6164_006692 [Bauhinia variegata]